MVPLALTARSIVSRAAEPGRRCRNPAWLAWVFGLTIICLTYLLLAYTFGNDGNELVGWFVPDGITLLGYAIEDSRYSSRELVESYQSMWGLAVLNAWLVGIHAFLPTVLNLVLLLLIFGSRPHHRRWPPVLLFLLVPYYLASFPLPSKDIVVAAFFVMAVHWYASERTARLPLALFVALLMFSVRDGYAVMLAVSFVYIAFVERFKLPSMLALILFGLGASMFWLFFERIFVGSFLYSRAIGVAEMGEALDVNTSNTPLGYFIRLVGNATNLAFRPIFLDTSGQFNVLSFFYWISGLTLFYAFICCLRAVLSEKRGDIRLGMLGLMSLLLVSLTPYVQPRYLLPITLLIPMFSFASVKHMVKTFLIIVPLSLVVSVVYQIAANYPPPAEVIPFAIATV